VEATTAEFETEDFVLQTSGAPFVLSLIRRNLFRDLIVFSAGSLLVFGVAVAAVYRRLRVVLGTLAACLTACGLTLLATRAFGIGIGLLTANLATIVFVLTLSHIVFITSNWKHLLQTDGEGRWVMIPDPEGHPVGTALRQTIPASFWCMVTTMLGFTSLLIATAKPLRELGLAGAIGTVISLVVAYSLYPAFLRNIRPHAEYFPGGEVSWARRFPERHAGKWWVAVSVLGVVGALGVLRLSTDPSLLSYFAAGSELRAGLEAIDRDGGSSPLNLVVADSGGGRLDANAMVERMIGLNGDLEADRAVGSLVSAPLVMEEAKRFPLLGRLSYRLILDIPIVGQLASGFIGEGRREALFVLRMRESERADSRSEVIERVSEITRRNGFDPVLLGGLYDLQGQLGRLIASSVRLGVVGLLVLFLGIGVGVSRSLRVGGAMVLSLTLVPLVVLGSVGHAGVALDIISAPAASIAMAMGVDSMIHLSMRVRRLRSAGLEGWEAWREARTELWHPIVGAALIICAGFGIFGLSSFPPTQRFGVLVILGTLTAAGMTLVMLPFAAGRQSRSMDASGASPTRAAGSRHIAQDGGTP
jgi:predicted RND superfamily exporter protein